MDVKKKQEERFAMWIICVNRVVVWRREQSAIKGRRSLPLADLAEEGWKVVHAGDAIEKQVARDHYSAIENVPFRDHYTALVKDVSSLEWKFRVRLYAIGILFIINNHQNKAFHIRNMFY